MAAKNSIVWLEVGKVHPNKYNPNVMIGEKFEALKEFCLSHGAEQLDPIWVRNDGVGEFEVIDGEHRWKAAKKVGWKRLRAFIIDLKEDDAKAFNVRKNRERGQLDAMKFGKILYEEKQKGLTCQQLAERFGYAFHGKVSDFIQIYEHRDEIRKALNIDPDGSKPLPRGTALRILHELKHEEQGESAEQPQTPEATENNQNLERFLTNYAEALKENPLPKIQKDDVQTAIDFFKRVLKQKNVVCPYCGEKHLQWKCGHEF